MELKLQDNVRIVDIKQKFRQKFPFLKLEFFDISANDHEKFTRKNLITDEQITLGEIRQLQQPGYVQINEHQSVGTLEHQFREYFGLNVQVFRRSGSSWIQTSNTDNWTLAEQNRKGEEMSTAFSEELPEEDIHEQP